MIHAVTDPAYLIGLIVLAVFLLIELGIAIYAGTAGEVIWPAAALLCIGLWALTLGGFALAAWPPLPGQYNRYVPVSGTVKQVGSRFIASDQQGGGTTQKFAVQFTNGRVYGCLDTRCSVLRRGQRVTLSCERAWQWNGIPGWDCNFGSYGLNRP